MPILDTLKKIINDKYNEVQRFSNENYIFNKIYQLEGNAVGQIGEKFVRTIFQENNIPILDNRATIHDEYDILTTNNIKIEIKTARLGKNNTFQFNGIEPIRNYSYIFLIGISGESLYWRILKWDECYHYEHSRRSGYCRCIENNVIIFDKKLVQMNPGNNVNYKLTLNKNEMVNENLENNFLEKILFLFG